MPTDDILKLIEANRLMGEIIDKMFCMLVQHISVDEFDADLLRDIGKAGQIMRNYE